MRGGRETKRLGVGEGETEREREARTLKLILEEIFLMIRKNGGINVIISVVHWCGPLSSCDCVIRLILLFTGESKESSSNIRLVGIHSMAYQCTKLGFFRT